MALFTMVEFDVRFLKLGLTDSKIRAYLLV